MATDPTLQPAPEFDEPTPLTPAPEFDAAGDLPTIGPLRPVAANYDPYEGMTRVATTPEQVRGWVTTSAHRHGLDPKLALALSKHESGWDNKAAVPKGDAYDRKLGAGIGPVQIISGTAALEGFMPDASHRERRQALLHDPEKATDLGLGHLAKLVAKKNGDVREALVAYRGGTRKQGEAYANAILASAKSMDPYITPWAKSMDAEMAGTLARMAAAGSMESLVELAMPDGVDDEQRRQMAMKAAEPFEEVGTRLWWLLEQIDRPANALRGVVYTMALDDLKARTGQLPQGETFGERLKREVGNVLSAGKHGFLLEKSYTGEEAIRLTGAFPNSPKTRAALGFAMDLIMPEPTKLLAKPLKASWTALGKGAELAFVRAGQADRINKVFNTRLGVRESVRLAMDIAESVPGQQRLLEGRMAMAMAPRQRAIVDLGRQRAMREAVSAGNPIDDRAFARGLATDRQKALLFAAAEHKPAPGKLTQELASEFDLRDIPEQELVRQFRADNAMFHFFENLTPGVKKVAAYDSETTAYMAHMMTDEAMKVMGMKKGFDSVSDAATSVIREMEKRVAHRFTKKRSLRDMSADQVNEWMWSTEQMPPGVKFFHTDPVYVNAARGAAAIARVTSTKALLDIAKHTGLDVDLKAMRKLISANSRITGAKKKALQLASTHLDPGMTPLAAEPIQVASMLDRAARGRDLADPVGLLAEGTRRAVDMDELTALARRGAKVSDDEVGEFVTVGGMVAAVEEKYGRQAALALENFMARYDGHRIYTSGVLKGKALPDDIAEFSAGWVRSQRPAEVKGLLKRFDQMQSWWKSWGLAIRPGYHARNFIQNLVAADAAGVKTPTDYFAFLSIQRAAKKSTGDTSEEAIQFLREAKLTKNGGPMWLRGPQEEIVRWSSTGGKRAPGKYDRGVSFTPINDAMAKADHYQYLGDVVPGVSEGGAVRGVAARKGKNTLRVEYGNADSATSSAAYELNREALYYSEKELLAEIQKLGGVPVKNGSYPTWLDQYGAILARKRGYDSIFMDVPGGGSEYVALTKNAYKLIRKRSNPDVTFGGEVVTYERIHDEFVSRLADLGEYGTTRASIKAAPAPVQEVSKLKQRAKQVGRALPFVPVDDNHWLRIGFAFGTGLENNARGAVFMNKLRRMADPVTGALPSDAFEQAALHVKKYLYDYSPQSLSKFENSVLRRLAPFYGFTRRNLPAQIEQLATQPWTALKVHKLKQNIESAYQMGDVPSTVLQEWQNDGLPIKMGRSEEDRNVFKALVLGSYLGVSDLEKVSRLSNMGETLAMMTTPIAKWAVEGVGAIHGATSSTSGGIDVMRSIQAGRVVPIDKGADANFLGMSMNPYAAHFLSSMLALNDLDRFNPLGAFGEHGDPEDRRLRKDVSGPERLLQYMTGLRLYKTDLDRAAWERTKPYLDRLAELEKEVMRRMRPAKQGKRGTRIDPRGARQSIEEMRRLYPELRSIYRHYQDLYRR